MSITNTSRDIEDMTVQDLLGLILIFFVGVLMLDLLRRLVLGSLGLSTLSTYLWTGIVDSLYIALGAVGLSMTYSILRFANFSHGDLITTGAFGGWTVAYLIAGVGVADIGSRLLLDADGGASATALGIDVLASPLAILIGMVAAAVVTIGVALLIDRLVYKRLRGAGGIPLLIASVGVALTLRYVIALVYTQDARGIIAFPPIRTVNIPPDWVPGSVGPVASFSVNLHELTLVVAALLLIVGIHLLLQQTKLGKAMRAMSDNRDLAQITGIPTERIITMTWVIGAGLAGVAGYLIVLDQSQISINFGWFLLLLIFAAVILGGIGSIYGALLGSLIIGLTINVSLVWIPADLNEVAAFTLMILILVIKPDGLLGGVQTA